MASAIKPGDPKMDEVRATLFTVAKVYNHDLTGARAKFVGVHFGPLQIIALEAIMETQLKSGDKSGAAATCKQIIGIAQAAPNSPVGEIVSLARLQYNNGDSSGARTTIQTALDAALKKSDEPARGEIAVGQAEIGDIDGALQAMMQIKKPSDQASVRKAIACARAKSGDVAGALALAAADTDAYTKTEVLVGTAEGILASLQPTSKP